MRRSQFTGDQIVRFLNEAAGGKRVRDLCEEHGFSAATFFRWKARYRGMLEDEAVRFRALEAELHELRRQHRLAEREREAVRSLLSAAYPAGRERQRAIAQLQAEGGLSERRACEVFGVPRTSYRREGRARGRSVAVRPGRPGRPDPAPRPPLP